MQDEFVKDLERRFVDRTATIGIIGLGYVGLPLALTACNQQLSVVGFDIDPNKVSRINSGQTYISHLSSEVIAKAVNAGRLRATDNFAEVADVDAIIICVPTPLTAHYEPDLSYVQNTAEAIAPYVRRGHLITLESTTWPGTTEEIIKPAIEHHGLKSGKDFFLAFSPEREDPGNANFNTESIPKVVGADDPAALRLVLALYRAIVRTVVAVSSTKTAEAVKLTENIFRAVNIALINELKIVYNEMAVDVWEVIEAAKTKPFGYMPFYPGPGLGGHCIPIDPFYLTWKAREYDIPTRFIELAGQINTAMPYYVVGRLVEALDSRLNRGLQGSKILILGVAYKKNVEDIRESPALKLIELLEKRGAKTDFYDPHVERITDTREYPHLTGRTRIQWKPEHIGSYDAVLIVTDHDDVDYPALCDSAKLVVDTRNACARVKGKRENVVKA